jgi:hypothetical protein
MLSFLLGKHAGVEWMDYVKHVYLTFLETYHTTFFHTSANTWYVQPFFFCHWIDVQRHLFVVWICLSLRCYASFHVIICFPFTFSGEMTAQVFCTEVFFLVIDCWELFTYCYCLYVKISCTEGLVSSWWCCFRRVWKLWWQDLPGGSRSRKCVPGAIACSRPLTPSLSPSCSPWECHRLPLPWHSSASPWVQNQ